MKTETAWAHIEAVESVILTYGVGLAYYVERPPAYKSTKDIFCLHEVRKVTGYNQISWKGHMISVPIFLPQGT